MADAERISRRGKQTKKPKRPQSGKVLRMIEQRARWIVREWERSPSYSYAEMIAATRDRFGCGETAAEQAYARANEIFHEGAGMVEAGRLIAAYWRLAEYAMTDPKPARGALVAAKIIDSIYDRTGLAAPVRHDVTFPDAQKLAHINVFGMTPAQRAQRERELLELAQKRLAERSAQLAAADPSIIDVAMDEVSAPSAEDSERDE